MAKKYKYGDRVSFLNDIGGGMVNRVDDQGYVYVLTEDGFEIPVLEKELVPAGNFNQMAREEMPVAKATPPNKAETADSSTKERTTDIPHLPKNVPGDASVNLLLGIIPENTGPVFTSKLSCYLVNDSPFMVYYLIGKKESGLFSQLASGYIDADTKNYVCTMDQTAISKVSDIHVQLLFISQGRYTPRAPADKLVNLNAINFSKESYYRNNLYFEDKAILFDLTGNVSLVANDGLNIPAEVKQQIVLADEEQPDRQKKKDPPSDTLEIDLHWDDETQRSSQLAPGAILALQMSRFHAGLEEALNKKLRRLVIIHGLGQGTLKMQIRKELQEKYPQYMYQDASFKEYGFGATMVHLVYDKKQ